MRSSCSAADSMKSYSACKRLGIDRTEEGKPGKTDTEGRSYGVTRSQRSRPLNQNQKNRTNLAEAGPRATPWNPPSLRTSVSKKGLRSQASGREDDQRDGSNTADGIGSFTRTLWYSSLKKILPSRCDTNSCATGKPSMSLYSPTLVSVTILRSPRVSFWISRTSSSRSASIQI